MKTIRIAVLALLVASLALAGCTTSEGPKLTSSQRDSVSEAATEFIDTEMNKVLNGKLKYASDLVALKSALTIPPMLFSDPNGDPSFVNLTWVPRSKPGSSSCDVSAMGRGSERKWTISCSMNFGSDGSCQLFDYLPTKISDLPTTLEDFYTESQEPKYTIDCEAYIENQTPNSSEVFFIAKPVKIPTKASQVAQALMSYGQCTGLPFNVKKIINYGDGYFHIVTTHVSTDPSAQGSSYDALTVVIQPKFDHYQLRQDGFGWESFFGCPMFDETYGKFISASGADLKPLM